MKVLSLSIAISSLFTLPASAQELADKDSVIRKPALAIVDVGSYLSGASNQEAERARLVAATQAAIAASKKPKPKPPAPTTRITSFTPPPTNSADKILLRKNPAVTAYLPSTSTRSRDEIAMAFNNLAIKDGLGRVTALPLPYPDVWATYDYEGDNLFPYMQTVHWKENGIAHSFTTAIPGMKKVANNGIEEKLQQSGNSDLANKIASSKSSTIICKALKVDPKCSGFEFGAFEIGDFADAFASDNSPLANGGGVSFGASGIGIDRGAGWIDANGGGNRAYDGAIGGIQQPIVSMEVTQNVTSFQNSRGVLVINIEALVREAFVWLQPLMSQLDSISSNYVNLSSREVIGTIRGQWPAEASSSLQDIQLQSRLDALEQQREESLRMQRVAACRQTCIFASLAIYTGCTALGVVMNTPPIALVGTPITPYVIGACWGGAYASAAVCYARANDC